MPRDAQGRPSGRAARRRVVICGAAGRDFHNFNVRYRDDEKTEVVAFTATQIPGIAARRYPPALAGRLYPQGIPIVPEADLAHLIESDSVAQVDFAYSDVTHAEVMHVGSRALAAGADFTLLGPAVTMLEAACPVIAVCAVRTGCGKSQVSRYLAGWLTGRGRRVGVLRHPMPYGNLDAQRLQRFAAPADLDAADCTLEEREEYEPHIRAGGVLWAGVDYEEILAAASAEADLLIWDGGNNDFPFIRPDLLVVVVDALRPDQLTSHYPGEAVLRAADLVVINKINSASRDQLQRLRRNLQSVVPTVPVVEANSRLSMDEPERVRGARILVVEDGPSVTHGGMPHGAGFEAVRQLAPGEIIDPRAFAVGSLQKVYAHFRHLGPVLPAMGYGAAQRAELKRTITAAAPDLVVTGTPIDLAAALDLEIPVLRVDYDYEDAGRPELVAELARCLAERGVHV